MLQVNPYVLLFRPDAELQMNSSVRIECSGAFEVSTDGDFLLYEWSRPYIWVARLALIVAVAWHIHISLTFSLEWRVTATATPERPVPPAPGATCCLGTLSPDCKQVSFYGFDCNKRHDRAGVVTINVDLSPGIDWFTCAPDTGRLDPPPEWPSNEEVIYPGEDGERYSAVPNATEVSNASATITSLGFHLRSAARAKRIEAA